MNDLSRKGGIDLADLKHLCLGCMRQKDTEGPCPHCNFDNDTQNDADYLELRAMLQSRYIVGKLLHFNGEGATYIGYDTQLQAPVQIREYFPRGLCFRSGAEVFADEGLTDAYDRHRVSFLNLAQALARMRSLTAILPVYDIFEENGTAYYVSETVESISLRDFLVRNGGALSFEQVRQLFMPIMTTLSALHAVDVIHRGISPETLIIGRDGRLRLTGFCIAEERTARTDLVPELYKGYAAIEQYGFDGDQGAWTDVYSLAASIYRALVGSPPPEATDRVTNDKLIIPADVADHMPAYAMSALADALQILPDDRTASIEQFRDEFSASPSVVTRNRERVSGGSAAPAVQRKKKSGSKKYVIISAAVTGMVLIALGILLSMTVFKSFFDPDDDGPATFTTVTGETENYSDLIIDPDKGEMPQLEGLNYSDLLSSQDSNLVKMRTNYEITVTYQKSDQDKGVILSQDIEAGSVIRKGDVINLVVSVGDGTAQVPNLRGKTRAEALELLWEAGFMYQNIRINEVASPGNPVDTVTRQSLEEGTEVDEFTQIEIDVNTYEEQTTTRPRPTYYYEPETEPPTTQEQTTASDEITTSVED